MPNTVARVVGRLIEVSVHQGYRSLTDVNEVFAEIARARALLASGERAVLVVDWRHCPIMSTEAAELLRARMTGNNAQVERSAALASRDSPVALLQFLRVIRESAHPDRRLFHDPEKLRAWLDDALVPAERDRLREFLSASL